MQQNEATVSVFHVLEVVFLSFTKLKSKVGLLYRSKNPMTPHAKRILYFAQIQSHLTYGLVIWGSMLASSQMKELQSIQNKCMQQINLSLPLKEVYRKYNILQLKSLVSLENVKIRQKIHLKKLPVRLEKSMLHDEKNRSLTKSHEYNTRNKSLANTPLTSNGKYYQSFLVTGVLEYNKLD